MSGEIAFLFPGQGSQQIGMGREWAEAFAVARQTLEEADDALAFHLRRLMWEGPEDELQLTTHTQPALLAVSTAVLRVVREAGLAASVAAGHSLGEYSALVAAGALDFPDALRLVRDRGRFMQEAVPVGEGAMAAIMRLDAEAVTRLAAEVSEDGQVCAVANYNSPQQTVVSGHAAAVRRAVELALERGARPAKLLPVSAPFHSPLMGPARDALAPRLAETAFRDPEPPVVSNVDAEPVTTAAAARDALERQVDQPVRWVESVHRMHADGARIFIEVGAGKVLTGLGKRIDPEARWVALPEPGALDEAVQELL